MRSARQSALLGGITNLNIHLVQMLATAEGETEVVTDNNFWNTLHEFGQAFVQNTGLAIVRTLAFLILGLVVIRVVQAITRSATLKSTRLDNSAASFVISLVTVILYVALVIVLVSSLGFSTAGIIAGFSAVALAVALALKDSLGSLANGVIIIFTKPFKKGDYIQVNDYDGLVQDIRLFNTKILTYSNEEIIIPNSEILSAKLINYSAMPLRRVVVSVPVPYDVDVASAKKIILDCISSYRYTVKTPGPSVILKEYGSSALMLSARAWTPNENYWDTLYDLTENIFEALKKNGISIPFDRLDVQLVNRDNSEKKVCVARPEQKSSRSKSEGNKRKEGRV